MAYSLLIKQEALDLYAEGVNSEQIAQRLSAKLGQRVDPMTIRRWRDKKEPPDEHGQPQDWETARLAARQKARERVLEQLERERANLAPTHLRMWSALAGQIERIAMVPVNGADGKQRLDEQGRPMFAAAELTPYEVSQLTAAAARVQTGQRTIFGLAAYRIETQGPTVDEEGHAVAGPMPADLVRAFEEHASGFCSDPAGVKKPAAPEPAPDAPAPKRARAKKPTPPPSEPA